LIAAEPEPLVEKMDEPTNQGDQMSDVSKPIEKDAPVLMPYWPDERIKLAFFREFTSPMNFERAYVAMIEAQMAKPK
jgi:hypothetical protein